MIEFCSPTADAHVEACCATGTSPGNRRNVSGFAPVSKTTFRAKIFFDHYGTVSVPIGFEESGSVHLAPILVLGGISATSHVCQNENDQAPGWWKDVVGRGLSIDPQHFRIIGIDYIGSPDLGWEPNWPITTEDQARAVVALLDRLKIERVTVVGASYGGMVGLALASSFPERVRRAVIMCAAHRPHPMATAVRAVQREIVCLGKSAGREADGVALARALAMTTYRAAEEFESRFSFRPKEPCDGTPVFPVEDYLRSRGRDFAAKFAAASFLRLSESIDLHEVEPARIEVPLDLLSVDSDVLAPPWLMQELQEMAPDVRSHLTIRSIFGHDAFLKETGAVSDFLNDVLAVEGGVG